ncbi:hypothetical protein JCM6882_004175 [Rhodosporidiobolus microsporus]
MKFFTLSAAAAAFAAVASAAPAVQTEQYNTTRDSPEPLTTIDSVSVGLQGPGRIYVAPSHYEPHGVLQLAKELVPVDNYINTTLTFPKNVEASYQLIITEHQRPVNPNAGDGTYSILAWNTTLLLEE